MSSIKIYDNFLDEYDATNLERIFCDESGIPWHYQSTVVSDYDDEDINDSDYNFQFTHRIYNDFEFVSEFKKFIFPIFTKLGVKVLIRAKFNLRPRAPRIYESVMHNDIPNFNGDLPYKTAIYYLNSNDGYTIFESGEKINSVANRIISFDGEVKHAGTTCTDKNNRVVLNINYF